MTESYILSNINCKEQQMIIEEVIKTSFVKTVKSVKSASFYSTECM